MNQTMSSTSEWMHFYNNNNNSTFSGQPLHPPGPSFFAGDRISDATVVTSAIPTGNSSPTATSRLSPEGGRVSKPARKRSRASRRTPTTLLNTDTSNFRAMVQQFTGGPIAPFPGGGGGGGVTFGFGGGGSRQNFISPMMAPPAAAATGFQIQQHQLFQQLQQQQQQNQNQNQNQNQQYLQFGLNNGGGGGGGSSTPAVDGFLQRLSLGGGGRGIGNSEGFVNANNNIEDGISSQNIGISSQMVGSGGAAASRPPSSSNENTSNSSFIF